MSCKDALFLFVAYFKSHFNCVDYREKVPQVIWWHDTEIKILVLVYVSVLGMYVF